MRIFRVAAWANDAGERFKVTVSGFRILLQDLLHAERLDALLHPLDRGGFFDQVNHAV